jgi:hypothetical protein
MSTPLGIETVDVRVGTVKKARSVTQILFKGERNENQ